MQPGVFAASSEIYPLAMDRFELSERWAPWTDLDVIFTAAHAAIEAGPLYPANCEVVFNEEFDPFTVDTLEQAQEDLRRNPHMMSMDINLSHIDEDEARVSLRYSGGRLLLSGSGRDWKRARAAYDAAQAVLAGSYGITTPKLPKRARRHGRRDTQAPRDRPARDRPGERRFERRGSLSGVSPRPGGYGDWMWRLIAGCVVLAAMVLAGAAPAQARCGPRTAAPLTWGIGPDADFEAQPPVMAYRPPSAASGLRDAAKIHLRGTALVACRGRTPLLLSRLRTSERLTGATQNGDRLGLRIAGTARDRLLVLHIGRRGVTSRRTLRVAHTGGRDRDPRILLSPDGGLAWAADSKHAAVWPSKARGARQLAAAEAEIEAIRPVDTGTMQLVFQAGKLSKPFAVTPPTPGRCHAPQGPTLAELGDLRVSPLVVTRYMAVFSGEQTQVLRFCDTRTGRTVAALRGTSSQAPNLHDSYTDQVTRLALAGGLVLAERRSSTSSGTTCGLRQVEILRRPRRPPARDGHPACSPPPATGRCRSPARRPARASRHTTRSERSSRKAWPPGTPSRPRPARQRSRPSTRTASALLDAQDRDTAPISDLRLDGNTLGWTVAGAPRQAQLAPGPQTVLTTRKQ